MEHKLRVAVLMGGQSSERAVSLSTGQMIAGALDPARYEIAAIDTQDLLVLPNPPAPFPASLAGSLGKGESLDIGAFSSLAKASSEEDKLPPDTSPSLARNERSGKGAGGSGGIALSEEGQALESQGSGGQRPDVVFIALHGKGGEDGSVQGMLEMLGLPYTGSGVLASALAMNKTMSKRLFHAAGVPVIEDIIVERGKALEMTTLAAQVERTLGFPVFVKPNQEGSTFGASLAESPAQLVQSVAQAFQYDSQVLIEKYVRGMEITVGVLENADGTPEALPVIEIVPKSAFYDYESKYAEGGSEHIIPARLSVSLTRRVQDIALQCHTLLGCRGMSRTDLIVRNEQPYVLEVNTIPGMTPTSLLPQAAAHAGISFPALLDRLIATALRHSGDRP